MFASVGAGDDRRRHALLAVADRHRERDVAARIAQEGERDVERDAEARLEIPLLLRRDAELVERDLVAGVVAGTADLDPRLQRRRAGERKCANRRLPTGLDFG